MLQHSPLYKNSNSSHSSQSHPHQFFEEVRLDNIAEIDEAWTPVKSPLKSPVLLGDAVERPVPLQDYTKSTISPKVEPLKFTLSTFSNKDIDECKDKEGQNIEIGNQEVLNDEIKTIGVDEEILVKPELEQTPNKSISSKSNESVSDFKSASQIYPSPNEPEVIAKYTIRS